MRTLSCNLQNFGLTYVYVVDPGAEQWPDKIVGLRQVRPIECVISVHVDCTFIDASIQQVHVEVEA